MLVEVAIEDHNVVLSIDFGSGRAAHASFDQRGHELHAVGTEHFEPVAIPIFTRQVIKRIADGAPDSDLDAGWRPPHERRGGPATGPRPSSFLTR